MNAVSSKSMYHYSPLCRNPYVHVHVCVFEVQMEVRNFSVTYIPVLVGVQEFENGLRV